jgi:hypothetical protein
LDFFKRKRDAVPEMEKFINFTTSFYLRAQVSALPERDYAYKKKAERSYRKGLGTQKEGPRVAVALTIQK